jgi:hypothetical protein
MDHHGYTATTAVDRARLVAKDNEKIARGRAWPKPGAR